MLPRIELDTTLNHLDSQYKTAASSDPRASQYYCKLAVIEFCGWIEEAQDLLVQESATRGGVWDTDLRSKVKRTYGFHFEDKFSPLLAHGMGYKTLRAVIQTLSYRPGSKFDSAVSTINSFVEIRNKAAHTHSSPGTTTYYQPSLVSSYLNTVAEGLLELETELISVGW